MRRRHCNITTTRAPRRLYWQWLLRHIMSRAADPTTGDLTLIATMVFFQRPAKAMANISACKAASALPKT